MWPTPSAVAIWRHVISHVQQFGQPCGYFCNGNHGPDPMSRHAWLFIGMRIVIMNTSRITSRRAVGHTDARVTVVTTRPRRNAHIVSTHIHAGKLRARGNLDECNGWSMIHTHIIQMYNRINIHARLVASWQVAYIRIWGITHSSLAS